MAIKASNVIATCRGLVSEDNEKYFKDSFMIHAINSASNHAFAALQTISEFLWLTKGTITISSADVTNKTLIYALAARTIYVSNYCTDPGKAGKDWRPNFDDGSGTTSNPTYWNIPDDYTISLPSFVLSNAPESTGTITYWYKASTAPITKPNDLITFLPDIAENYFIEYVMWYLLRRDEQPLAEIDPILNAEILKIRRIMTNSSGSARGFVPNWDDVADYDG